MSKSKVIGSRVTTKKTNVSAFFKSPENKKIIKSNQNYSARVTTYIRENIAVKEDVLAQPFTI